MVEAVVFDFDGVLVNSEPMHLAAYQEVFAGLGVELSREEYYNSYLGYDDEGVFRAMAAAHGWPLDNKKVASLIAEKCRVFDAMMETTDVLYPGAIQCVERLANEFPLGIASGALRHEIETVLRRAKLRRHFRFIVGSGDTPASKPSPDPYIRAAQLHQLPPHACVAIEDSRWGLASAKGAGLHTVGITTTYSAAELPGADRIIDHLDEFNASLIRSL